MDAEEAVFTFPLGRGGEQLQPAPCVFMPSLTDTILSLLDRLARLTWHQGNIPNDKIWVKIGGDKGDASREEQAAIALDQLASWLALSAPNEQTASTQVQQIQQQAKQHKQKADKQSARSAKLAGEKFKTAEGPTVTSITESLKKLKIGVERQAYHGGSFIGNNVQKCLKEQNIEILCTSIVATGAPHGKTSS
ncbi:uncharacterized protein LOC134190304 [Corticium candelabrum]|uniref:uncharacterized protein LOC134190304 n=1 Tax=Corticium candelabrum TaxID=121492 RepID=UPI002E25F197|nr:uncharacterized protein LOC134190304 [Corticium candelabrum]